MLYVYGALRYRDLFTPDHITMFCLEARRLDVEVVNNERMARTFHFSPCERHNCIEEDCKDEPRAGLSPPP
jgi:hypothetical protein